VFLQRCLGTPNKLDGQERAVSMKGGGGWKVKLFKLSLLPTTKLWEVEAGKDLVLSRKAGSHPDHILVGGRAVRCKDTRFSGVWGLFALSTNGFRCKN
jgi:hypothetical protein